MVGVLMLLQAEGLSIEGLVEVFELGLEDLQFTGVPMLVGAG
ncbi:MAG: hypothetical protein ACHP93_02145 [Solirubrobacterales bacterium]